MMKKRTVFLALLLIMTLLGVAFLFWRPRRSSPDTSFDTIKTESSANVLQERIVYERALLRAKEWKSDAVLAHMAAMSTSEARYTFISESAPGVGFAVVLQGSEIITAEKVEYAGSVGAPFPSSSVTKEEAIERVRRMPGYEEVEVLGVEAVYGKTGEVWYFGVHTDKGTVSIEAR